MAKANVLFLCTGNSARSQMAEALLRRADDERFEAHSAGLEPSRINPLAIEAMAEVGVDITANRPQRWSDATLEAADVIVTMGCGDTCPVLPGKRYVDWELTDPAGKPLEEVRPIRDDIRDRVENLLNELGVERVG